MEFSSKQLREGCVGVMKEISASKQPEFDQKFMDFLTNGIIIQRKLQELGFQEGAWYRPLHNVIVPASMLAIINKENYNADLIYPAQLHDVGNSVMKIASTTKGASWESVDKRWKHMELGADMLEEYIAFLKSLGSREFIEISDKRVRKLSNLVRTHDLPYIRVANQTDIKLPKMSADELFQIARISETDPVGFELIDLEARALRGADRTFVPSALSWYKDMIAHFSDQSYLGKAKKIGFELSPREFLLCRMTFFYEQGELPKDWDENEFPLEERRAIYNEGGMVEKPYTLTDRFIIDAMMKRRAGELEQVEGISSAQRFGDFFERALVDETMGLINYSNN